jgi:hypothetical protein
MAVKEMGAGVRARRRPLFHRGISTNAESVRIATCNVNGVNGRLANLLQWLAENAPDFVCLQE